MNKLWREVMLSCCADEDDGESVQSRVQGLNRDCRIVLISGFESFNVDLYRKACTSRNGH
jgi:hypothetical protein